MLTRTSIPISDRPDRFVLPVVPELTEAIVRNRWQHVNAVLRVGMMNGMQMQLDATLMLLCDTCSEITAYDHAAVYFWDPKEEHSLLRLLRGPQREPKPDDQQPARIKIKELLHRNNVIDHWCRVYRKPVRVELGQNQQADKILSALDAKVALGLPLFVNSRVMGSLQLVSSDQQAFTHEDAQLLWLLLHIAENLLTREYANESLMLFAFTDHLTGLRTRGYFEQQLELEIKRSDRKSEPCTLLMLDIDHFKRLNDSFGHSIGDQVLREMAKVFTQDMREVDTVARYGGEEFVIILPDTTAPEGYAVAERIRSAVERTSFLSGPETVCLAPLALTISIGIATIPADTQGKQELVDFADAALYAAKSLGRNRIMRYADVRSKQREAV